MAFFIFYLLTVEYVYVCMFRLPTVVVVVEDTKGFALFLFVFFFFLLLSPVLKNSFDPSAFALPFQRVLNTDVLKPSFILFYEVFD